MELVKFRECCWILIFLDICEHFISLHLGAISKYTLTHILFHLSCSFSLPQACSNPKAKILKRIIHLFTPKISKLGIRHLWHLNFKRSCVPNERVQRWYKRGNTTFTRVVLIKKTEVLQVYTKCGKFYGHTSFHIFFSFIYMKSQNPS